MQIARPNGDSIAMFETLLAQVCDDAAEWRDVRP